MTNRVVYRVDLSDNAWAGLKAMAQSANFMRIAPFLMACREHAVTWHDARPDEIRQASSLNTAPLWYTGDSRHQRTLGALPVAYLLTVAFSHDIRAHSRQAITLQGRNPERSLRVQHRQDSTWQIINAVLEAIGLDFLRPDDLSSVVIPPKYTKKPLDMRPVIL